MASRLPVASGFYNYTRIAKNTTNYTKRMNRLSNNIFNEVVRPRDIYSKNCEQRFAAKPLDVDPGLVDFYDYMRHPQTDSLMDLLRSYGLYRDEHRDFNEQMERLRQIRGKGRNRFFERNADKSKKGKK